MSQLPSISETIRAAGLRADKRLGQHFLLDPGILQRIAQTAGVTSGEFVLEIGPGPGGLTRALLGLGAVVHAIERDQRCVNVLQALETAYPSQLTIIEADALKIKVQDIMGDARFKIVANLPYNIGTELLTRWMLQSEQITSIHVLLQKEVAERLIASPCSKAYGRLAILAQTLCRVECRFDLPAAAFHPPPKVVSSLVSLWPKPNAPADAVLQALQRLTHQAFQQRRKMLRTSLKGLEMPVDALLNGTDVTPDQRPEMISPETFLKLAQNLVAG